MKACNTKGCRKIAWITIDDEKFCVRCYDAKPATKTRKEKDV